MPNALLKFTQGATIGGDGHALEVTGAGGDVVIEAVNGGDVATWLLELLYAPTGSGMEVVPGVPLVLASGTVDDPIQYTLTPHTTAAGCYRCRLTLTSPTAVVDVDIRNIGVRDANGFIPMPYQDLPRPLPLEGSGAKPDELNFEGQPYGWAGRGGGDGLFLDALGKMVPVGSGDVQLVYWANGRWNVTPAYPGAARRALVVANSLASLELLSSDDVTNESTVAGASVTAALDQLDADLATVDAKVPRGTSSYQTVVWNSTSGAYENVRRVTPAPLQSCTLAEATEDYEFESVEGVTMDCIGATLHVTDFVAIQSMFMYSLAEAVGTNLMGYYSIDQSAGRPASLVGQVGLGGTVLGTKDALFTDFVPRLLSPGLYVIVLTMGAGGKVACKPSRRKRLTDDEGGAGIVEPVYWNGSVPFNGGVLPADLSTFTRGPDLIPRVGFRSFP